MQNLISEVMTKDLSTVHWLDSLQFAEEKMHRSNIRHLPVVDDHGHLVGIISDRDIQRGRSAYTDFVDRELIPSVADYMTQPVEQISSHTELQEVIHRMITYKISAYVVVENKQLVGIVTTDDLLRILLSVLDHPANPSDDHFDALKYYSPIGEIANFFNQAGI